MATRLARTARQFTPAQAAANVERAANIRGTFGARGGATIVQEAIRRRMSPAQAAALVQRQVARGGAGEARRTVQAFRAAGLRMAITRGSGRVVAGTGTQQPMTQGM